MSDIRAEFKESLSTVCLYIGISIAVIFAVNIVSSIFNDSWFMNNRVSIVSFSKAVSTIIIITFLVLIFKPLRSVIYIYLNGKYDSIQGNLLFKVITDLLILFHSVTIYYMLAKQPGTEFEAYGTHGYLGSPYIILNKVSDNAFIWIYDFTKWIALFLIIGSLVYLIVQSMPMLKMVSEDWADKAVNKSFNKEEDDSK